MRIINKIGWGGSDRIVKRVAQNIFGIGLTILMGFGCSSDAQREQGVESPTALSKSAVTASPGLGTVGEAAGNTDVAIKWKQVASGGAVKKASDSLIAQLTNNTNIVQQGRIILAASGLDGRLVELEVGKFNLAASSSSDVAVPISKLAVQSEVAPSFAALQVELYRGKEVLRPSQTRPVYYIFSGGFAQAELYTADEVAKLPNGGLRTTNTMDVRGRVLDVTGAVQEVTTSTLAVSAGSGQGLSKLGTKRARPSNPPPFATTSAATSLVSPAALTSFSVTNNIRLYWTVWYTDSALGEDVFNTSGWQNQQASYTWISISSLDLATNYYYSPVDRNGKTYVPMNLPPSTQLVVHVWTDWMMDENGTRFDNLMSTDGTNLSTAPTEGDIYFTTSPSGNYQETRGLYFPYNTEAVHTAAVAGLTLKTSINNSNSMGISPGTNYRLYANLGCPIGVQWWQPTNYDSTMSCYAGIDGGGFSNVYYGTQSGGNNEEGAWWKFIIAHEIGHAIQERGLGILGVLNYTHGDDPTKKSCRCDNVSTPSLRLHCLNSREDFNAAEIEGFAQFFATKLFNNDTQANATMVYYKQFQNSDSPPDYTNPPMAKDGFGNVQRQWMKNHCTTPLTSRGTEYDWLQFYYDIGSQDNGRAGTRTRVPNLFDIYRTACTGGTDMVCTSTTNPPWATIQQAAGTIYANDARYTRFVSASTYHAVNY